MTIGKIASVQARSPHRLVLEWDDGTRDEVDIAPTIDGRTVLAPLRDHEVFGRVYLSDDGWSVEWPDCGIDLGAAQLRRWADEQAGRAMPREAFRAWIDRHGLTLDAAADALGLSRRTVAYYLSGEQPISKTVLLATEGYDHRQAA